MSRYICIHGHFYQPPRENPWLNVIELQDAAYPYHDWNERISAECYARNAASRVLDGNKNIVDIVNNYSKMSFNFGPTLLSWMEINDGDVYQSILEADRLSQKQFSGHGSALAQVYNHIIMPLANHRDKRTQVLWGIKDFEHRFKRKPEGMWLAETAVDLETLDIMAESEIKFTILAPRQAKRVRKLEDGGKWKNVTLETIDPKMPYLCQLPSGRSICIFIYDGLISQAVAFEGLLNNGENFANRMVSGFDNINSEAQLLHIATDGESYGHHHKFGDMALAYCLNHIEKEKLAKITNYGEFLERFPPKWEIEINENTSWSCDHGIERWRNNCGCHTGYNLGWQQKWRGPLRDSLDWLREQLILVYEKEMGAFTQEGPWTVRDHYIDVILNRSRDNVESFLTNHIAKDLSDQDKSKALKLLEMQFNALLMYTSCGWYFDEISGIETVQIIKYAARAIQLAKDTQQADFEPDFVKILEQAPSNIPAYGNGAWVYNNYVKPSVVDLLRVGAHYAVSSLFEKYPRKLKMYCYNITGERYERKEAGRRTLAIGKGWIESQITWEKSPISFVVLHLGDHNIAGGVDQEMEESRFESLYRDVERHFTRNNIPDVIRLLDRFFENKNYSLWHLFKDEQQKILNEVLQSTMDEIEASFRQIYDHHFPLVQMGRENPVTLPRALATVVEFILNRDLINLLQSDEIDMERLASIIEDMKRWSFEREKSTLIYVASTKINHLMKQWQNNIDDINVMATIEGVIKNMSYLSLDLDLWKAQNIYFSINREMFQEIENRAKRNDSASQQWISHFNGLSEVLKIKIG